MKMKKALEEIPQDYEEIKGVKKGVSEKINYTL
jgi:hypothetical protein